MRCGSMQMRALVCLIAGSALIPQFVGRSVHAADYEAQGIVTSGTGDTETILGLVTFYEYITTGDSTSDGSVVRQNGGVLTTSNHTVESSRVTFDNGVLCSAQNRTLTYCCSETLPAGFEGNPCQGASVESGQCVTVSDQPRSSCFDFTPALLPETPNLGTSADELHSQVQTQGSIFTETDNFTRRDAATLEVHWVFPSLNPDQKIRSVVVTMRSPLAAGAASDFTMTSPTTGESVVPSIQGQAEGEVTHCDGSGSSPQLESFQWVFKTALPGNEFAAQIAVKSGACSGSSSVSTADAFGNPQTYTSTSTYSQLSGFFRAETPPLKKYTVSYTTFIPGDHIDGPPQSICLLPLDAMSVRPLIFGADNRSFDRDAFRFRTRQIAVVAPDDPSISDGLEQKANLTTLTTAFERFSTLADGVLDVATDIDTIQNDCYLLHKAKSAGTEQMHVEASRISDSVVEVHFFGRASDPLVPIMAFSVDWDFRVRIDASNPDAVTYTVEGDHDGFPAHELYIETPSGAVIAPIQFTPPGNPPFSLLDASRLLPMFQVHVSGTGVLP